MLIWLHRKTEQNLIKLKKLMFHRNWTLWSYYMDWKNVLINYTISIIIDSNFKDNTFIYLMSIKLNDDSKLWKVYKNQVIKTRRIYLTL